MAQVIASYSGTVTGSGNIYVYKQANNASGTNGFYTSGNSVMIYAKNGSPEASNGFYRIGSSPGGWMYTYNVTNIQPNYQTVTDPCTPPDSVTLDTSTGVLTITGGAGGDLNTLTGWGISYAEKSIGGSYGTWSADTDTASRTPTVTVPPGKVRKFRARTKGSAGSSYYSAYVECPTEYIGITACTPPTSIVVSNSTPVADSEITLSWSGAGAGVSNTITGYDIYRSESAGGTYTLLTSVATTATSGNINVISHPDFGGSYYFKVMTKGSAGASYYSPISTVYASATSGYGACSAPNELKLSSLSAYPGALVKLSWSDAEAGYGNDITGYEIHRATSSAGTYSLLSNAATTQTEGNALVAAPSAVGTSYYYKVRTVGTVPGYNSGLSAAHATLMATEPVVLAGTTGRTNAVIE